MNYVSFVIELGILVLGWLLYQYIKKIPDSIHARSLKEFEYTLSSKLEELKSSFTEKIELFKITQTEIQLQKSKRALEFSAFLADLLTSGAAQDPAEILRRKKVFADLGASLFLFASDDVIYRFIEFKEASVGKAQQPTGPLFVQWGAFFVSLRKDLGFTNTLCTSDDFLRSIY
jgi:hypothetical protein